MTAQPDLVPAIIDWYRANARDLPWRSPDATPWSILVSEFMLQQTPVVRVEPVWQRWMRRWPQPADLAAEPVGEAIAAWDRLGYPRRAIRLHGAAAAITNEHANVVPSDPEVLRQLPGVGQYTAAAVASFAYAVRAPVLDTNVRRVLGRALDGRAHPTTHIRAAEWERAETLLPEGGDRTALWNVAAMELGAVICTARVARCDQCPIAVHCRWRASGKPVSDAEPRRGQPWHGTDRQCRGVLMREVRAAHPTAVSGTRLLAQWPDQDQALRALGSLNSDGLLEQASLADQDPGPPKDTNGPAASAALYRLPG